MKPAGLDQWFIFRDVFEVDARAVRDRENRFAKLFLESRDTVTAIERAHEIATASAQFNIRPMGTVDNPMLALGFLQRVYRPRFRFTLRGRDAEAGPDVVDPRVPGDGRPTLMRGTDNKDVFARGRYWVDAGSGRIVRTEVVFNALGTESSVTTSFEMDERLGTSVPVRDALQTWRREKRSQRGRPPTAASASSRSARRRRSEVKSRVDSRQSTVESRK